MDRAVVLDVAAFSYDYLLTITAEDRMEENSGIFTYRYISKHHRLFYDICR